MDERAFAQAHDHLFKLLLEQPGVAGSLLRERLPAAVAARLAAGGPERVPASFVGEELRETRADRHFRLPLRDGSHPWVHCLIEHKSAPDAHLELQLLGYLAADYAQLAVGAGPHGPLPLIVALVVFHGPSRWAAPRRFSDRLSLDDELRLLALDFPIEVFDVGRFAPADVSANPHLRGGLLLLHHAVCPPAGDRLRLLVSLLEDLRGMSPSFLEAVGSYAFRYFPGIRLEELRMAIMKVMPENEERMLATAAEQLQAESLAVGEAKGIAKGIAIGRAESRAEGIAIGRAEGALLSQRGTLLRLLERRFGTVSSPVRAKVEAASAEQLDEWLDRFLEASSPDELLDQTDR
jgi:predicted transposase YdaD